MTKKIFKLCTSIFLVATLFVGCSTPQSTGSTNETSTSETKVKETIAEQIDTTSDTYVMTQRTLTTSLDGIQKYSIQDEKILGVGYVTDVENRVISYYLTSWEENWREEWVEKKKIELPFTTSSYRLQCQGLDMDADGNTYVILTDDSENHIYFLTVDSEGEIIGNLDIVTTLPEGIYISGMSVGSDAKVYVEDNQENVVYGLDTQGNFVGEYQLEEGNLWGLQKTNDGTVHLVTEKKNQLYVNLPIEGEEILFQSQEQGIPVNQYMDVYEGLENNFFVTTVKGLLSYKLEEETTTQLVDWSLSGIDYTTIDYVGVMKEKEEQVITMISEGQLESDTTEIYTFVKSDGSEEKQYIILATLGVDSELKKQIVAYNKLNPDYPIQIKNYTNNEEGIRKLNTDLLAGNVIDMIDFKSLEGITSLAYYAEQGLLEDIGKWLEEDETIDENDFFPNILEANKINGILYNLVPRFVVETFAGAKSIVGDDFVWSMKEAIDIMEYYPEKGMYAFQSKKQFIEDACRYNGGYLVNEKDSCCQFTSYEWIQVLKYANTLPDNAGNSTTIDARDTVYYQKNLLIKKMKFDANLFSYREAKGLMKEGVAQDQVSFVGFPTIDEDVRNGSVFSNMISISMASNSNKKDMTWKFFQYLLSEAYQYSENAIGFPIRESDMQSFMNQQLTNEIYAASSFGNAFSGWGIKYGYVTQEDIDTVTSFLHSINRLAWENETIINIVWEEAQYYFAGECTAEEAAQAMQSRVELYLMEKE